MADAQHARARQQEILSVVRRDGHLDVMATSKLLSVSPETVRRDLRTLEEHGLVRRAYGGAYPVESAGYETDLRLLETDQLAEKRRIAAEAAEHLDNAETVFLDEGFLPQLIAQALPTERELTVVTGSLPVATLLAPLPTYRVFFLGGLVRGRTLATVEHWATRMLAEFVIDLAYIAANGISLTEGLTTPDPRVADLKSAVIKGSRRKILVGEYTRFGVSSFCRFGRVGEFDMVISDTRLSSNTAQRYSAAGPDVLRV